MTDLRERRKLARQIRRDFLRKHAANLPKYAPSGQPLRWQVDVIFDEQPADTVHENTRWEQRVREASAAGFNFPDEKKLCWVWETDEHGNPIRTLRTGKKDRKKKASCDCNNHCLQILRQIDGETATWYRKCYVCLRAWTEIEPFEPPQRPAFDVPEPQPRTAGGRLYHIEVRQKTPGILWDNNVYRYNVERRQLERVDHMKWGY